MLSLSRRGGWAIYDKYIGKRKLIFFQRYSTCEMSVECTQFPHHPFSLISFFICEMSNNEYECERQK